MQPRHRVSKTAIELITRFEGYRRKAAELPDGRWTIGYGHTLTARQGAEVSREDAESLLRYDLIGVTADLNDAVFSPLTQNQFDALTAFVFSIGRDNFRHSGVLKRLNEGALIQAACALELWRKAEVGGERIVVDALVRRRSAEKALFLTPEGEAWIPAPSAVLRPQLDTDAHDVVPLEAPATVTASMDGETIVVTREYASLPQPVPPEDETEGPSRAAAEAVTARLQTIFQEPVVSAPPEPISEPAPVEPPVHPENIPEEPQPQADFAPPGGLPDVDFHEALLPEDDASEPPFALEAQLGDDLDADPLVGADEAQDLPDEDQAGPDLFAAPAQIGGEAGEDPGFDLPQPPANDLPEDSDGDLAFLSRLPDGEPTAPFGDEAGEERYEFVAPATQPLPQEPRSGIITLAASAVLGLAFFGGGVFWATNARPMTASMWLDPRVVGWLAVIAGIGFFAVSAFLLLERLGAMSERQARYRR